MIYHYTPIHYIVFCAMFIDYVKRLEHLHNKLIVCDFKVLIINILSFEKKYNYCSAHVFTSEAVNDWLPIEFVIKEK